MSSPLFIDRSMDCVAWAYGGRQCDMELERGAKVVKTEIGISTVNDNVHQS
jgi:hypothetical protein